MKILARLTAQATGATKSRLRPKQPGRFEDAGLIGEGLNTISEETHAERPVARGDVPVRGGDTSGLETRTVSETRKQSLRPLPPDNLVKLATSAAPNTQNPATPDAERSAAPDVEGPVAPRPAGQEPVAPEDADQHRLARDPAEPRAVTVSSPSARKLTQFKSVTHDRHGDPATPPEPLLPPAAGAKIGHTNMPMHDAAPQVQSRMEQHINVAPRPVAPEVTIHIGRIDLRDATPKRPASKSKASKPKRPVSALSDYLKGGGS